MVYNFGPRRKPFKVRQIKTEAKRNIFSQSTFKSVPIKHFFIKDGAHKPSKITGIYSLELGTS